MKNNWQLIFNPFTRIAGLQALIAGLAVALLTGVIGTLSGVAFDGVLNAHTGPGITYALSFTLLGIDVASIVVVMWLAALVTSRDFRFVDIVGTMVFARAPMLLVALTAFFVPASTVDPAALLANPASFLTVGTVIFLLFAILCTIWYILRDVFLVYNKAELGLRYCRLSPVSRRSWE